MSKLFGPTGVKGIDVTTPRGKKAYNADRSGFINIDNPAHARQAKAEGFVQASLYNSIGERTPSDVCPRCEKIKFVNQEICHECRKHDLNIEWLENHKECFTDFEVCPCVRVKESLNG